VAIKLADAVVYLATNSDKLKEGLNAAKETVSGAAGGMGSTFQRMATGAVVAAGAAMAAGILTVGKAAFDVSTQTRAAANDMAAALGIPIEQAEKFAQVAKRVYGNNFAESVTDAAEVVKLLNQQLQLTADNPALQKTAEQAIALRDVFDADVSQSIDAAKVLMDDLGLSSEQAFDFIAKGFQKGLNSSDDFLDTIREYTNQFGDAGFSAEQMFSILETGAKAGVLGTDKIADAIKEMTVRLNEGGDAVSEAFGQIGLSFEQVQSDVKSGNATWGDYFEQIVGGLNGIEDPILRSQAQVAIFGTMAEDLGVSFTEGLSSAKTSMADMEGAADSLNAKYKNLGDFLSATWRKVVIAVTPATDKFLELAVEAMPKVEKAIDALTPILTNLVVNVIVPLIERVAEWIIAFGNLSPAMQKIITSGGGLLAALVAIVGIAWPIISGVTAMVGVFTSLGPVVAGAGAVIAALGGPITLIIALVAALALAWKTNFLGIRDITNSAIDAIKSAWQSGTQALSDLASRAWSSIRSGTESFLSTQRSAFDSAWSAIKSAVASAFDFIKSIISGALDSVRTRVDSAISGIRSAFDSIRNSVTSAVQGIRNAFNIDWGALGRGIIDGIRNGISNGVQGIKDAATNAAKSALDAAKSALGISSPSRKARQEVGPMFTKGTELGIIDMIPQLVRNVQRAFGGILPDISATLQPGSFAQPQYATAGNPFVNQMFDQMRQVLGSLGGGGITLQQNFYGPADPAVVQAASSSGIRDALRARGL
jgi:phage-related minor tail protein